MMHTIVGPYAVYMEHTTSDISIISIEIIITCITALPANFDNLRDFATERLNMRW